MNAAPERMIAKDWMRCLSRADLVEKGGLGNWHKVAALIHSGR